MSAIMLQPINRIYSDFENFAWSNNILASTVGFTIGMATKDLIENMAKHAGIPTIEKLYTSITRKSAQFNPTTHQFKWSDSVVFISLDILKWLGILLMTFLIGTYILQWIVNKSKLHNFNQKQEKEESPLKVYEYSLNSV